MEIMEIITTLPRRLRRSCAAFWREFRLDPYRYEKWEAKRAAELREALAALKPDARAIIEQAHEDDAEAIISHLVDSPLAFQFAIMKHLVSQNANLVLTRPFQQWAAKNAAALARGI